MVDGRANNHATHTLVSAKVLTEYRISWGSNQPAVIPATGLATSSWNKATDQNGWFDAVEPGFIVPDDREAEFVRPLDDRVRWNNVPFAFDFHAIVVVLHIVFNLFRLPTVGGRTTDLTQGIIE